MTPFLIYLACIAIVGAVFIVVGNRMLGPQEPL